MILILNANTIMLISISISWRDSQCPKYEADSQTANPDVNPDSQVRNPVWFLARPTRFPEAEMARLSQAG
jgi:hypothetical protein